MGIKIVRKGGVMKKRKAGVLLILIGIGIPLVLFFFNMMVKLVLEVQYSR